MNHKRARICKPAMAFVTDIYIGERRLGGKFREPISRDPQKVETSAKSHFKDNRLNCGLGGFLSPRKAFETVL